MTVDEAQNDAIIKALERIAAALERMERGFAGEPLGEPAALCEHPPNQRKDLGGTMGHPHWRCELCGYEHKE